MNGATVEQVGDIRAGLGESPVWDAARNRLLWIDIRLHRLYSTDIVSGETRQFGLPGSPGCVALTETGEMLLAIGQDLVNLSAQGELRNATCLPAGRVGRFNDGKPDAAGRFWVGTAAAKGRCDAGLWRFETGRESVEVVPGISMSNGLGWSPDGARMYYVDSMTHRIDAFAYDVDTGTLSDRTPWVVLADGYLPDGLCVDADGCVWLAVWGLSAVLRFSPGGEELGRIAVPTPLVTSCAFGGSDLGTLYITTASEDDTDPNAGRLFAVKTGAKGLPPNRARLGQ